jgi:hypothetical protein
MLRAFMQQHQSLLWMFLWRVINVTCGVERLALQLHSLGNAFTFGAEKAIFIGVGSTHSSNRLTACWAGRAQWVWLTWPCAKKKTVRRKVAGTTLQKMLDGTGKVMR